MFCTALNSARIYPCRIVQRGIVRLDARRKQIKARAMVATSESIELTDLENKIFDTLLAAREHHKQSTVLRCAGGWVRDKLLGRTSHDIDIALDDTTGREFAEKVNAYLISQGQPATSVGVIAANPDQSKHLETATLKVHGMMLDLVNLRSEKYSEASRIPVITVGTPLDDAERRDFTINSLFYNLNTRAVEDMTGRGLQDLRDGIIRTPLEPETTFLDDPLRVLRAVRFASRYQFTMVDDLKAAARSDKVRSALEKKITRERVGVEVAGMLQGPHPVLSAEHILDLLLFPVVFSIPDPVHHQVGPNYGNSCMEVLRHGHRLMLARNILDSDDSKRVACITALLLPLRCVQVPLKKGKTQPLTKHIIRESLKWRAKDADQASQLHEGMVTMRSIYQNIQGLGDADLASAPSELRARLGNCLRNLKELVPAAIALFPLLDMDAAVPLGGDMGGCEGIERGSFDESQAEGMSAAVDSAVHVWGLRDCHTWKPLLNGEQITTAVGLERPGPVLGMLTTAAMDWQLANPTARMNDDGSAPEALVAHLRSYYRDLAESGKIPGGKKSR